MRIRYGKPVKAKSLFNYHSLTTYFQNLFTGGAKAWGDNLFTNTDNKDYLYSIFEPNKKYYVWIKATCVEYNGEGKEEASNFANIFWFSNMFTTNNPLSAHYLKYTGDTWEQSFQIQTKADPDFSNATFWYFYTNRYTDGTLNKVKFDMVILEIDESQGLTKEYYDNHKTNFPLIATGEEITIDDKSGNLPLSRLPAEYQEVEYIEGDGNQYMREVNLNNIEVKGGLTFGCKFKVNEHSAAMYFSTITSSLDRYQTYSLGYTGATSPLYLRWNQQADSTTSLDYNVGDIYEIIKTNNTECTLYDYSIFCHGTNYGPWKGRCYYYYLKLNEKYIFNWVPCYRKSDNVIGMYDLVSKTFITNQGSGSFTKGNNINNTIFCKVAGGSSDVYYGYNQRVIPNDNTTHNGNACSYDPDTNTFTLTANTSTTTYYFGLSCTKLTGMPGHKVLFIGNVTEVSTTAPFTDITGEWAMTNVTDRQRATGVGLTYCIGEWRNVTSNYINITTSTNFTVGDYFKIKDVQIIDLTDWFGAGKEPNTYEEFREKFIKEYYGPCAIPIKLTQYQIEALPNYRYNQMIPTAQINIDWTYDNSASSSAKWASHTLNGVGWGSYVGHKILFYFNGVNNNSNNSQIGVYIVNANNQMRYLNAFDTGVIIPITQQTGSTIQYGTYIEAGEKLNIQGSVVSVDLTEWYGEGNEPTVEEFRKTFPNKNYPYSQKRLLNKYMINKLQA